MKKLLLILFLFISYTSFSQGKIGSDGNVIPTGNYPIVASKDIKGGLHKFQTIIERDALPANYRDTGMLSYVVDSLKFYYLKDGIGNSNWQELTLKSAGGYFATNHPYPVQTIVEMLALDTAKVGDIAIVADSSKSYVLSEIPSSVQANWLELLSPVLANTDYLPEGSTHLYSTTQRIRNAISADWGITYDNTAGKIKADSSALKDIFYNKDSIDAKISRIETGSGSVTSVAKGYGILQDGTITTTGTITVDSAALADKFKRITDSTDVSMLNGGKIDTSRLPISKLYIQQAGAGETHIIRASNDTTLSVATLKNTDDITPVKNSDSSVSFNFTHPHYTKDQIDSIKATITTDGITRAELIDTANNKVNKTDVSGGTINQVLKKNSSTDYDWSWQNESGGGGGCDTCIAYSVLNTEGTIQYLIRENGDTARAYTWIADGSSGSSGSNYHKQTYTGTSSVTIADNTTLLVINPSSLVSAETITTPANPSDGQRIDIVFGGTILTGAVITTLTLTANTGQIILGTTVFNNVSVMDRITITYNSSNSKWYR